MVVKHMKIRSIIVPVCLLFLTLAVRCKSDDPAAKIPIDICLPTVIFAPQFLTELYFNQENKIYRFKWQQQPYIYATDFVYDSKGERIMSAYFMRAAGLFSGFASIASTGVYTYDNNGNLTVTDSTVMGTTYRITYQYNSTNQLITSSQFYYSNGTEYLQRTTTYGYPNDSTRNPALINDTSGASGAYTYDDKPNPARLMGFPSILPDNNVTKLTYSQGASTTISSYRYQYNEKGYPILKISGTDTTHWTYDCKTVYQ